MKLKQINPALFKLFIPSDELEERGIKAHLLALHSMETHCFFQSIVQEALTEIGCIGDGHFQMDVYIYPTYGIYMMLKRGAIPLQGEFEEDIEQSVSIHIIEQKPIIYEFAEFDDVVQACRITQVKWNLFGALYYCHSHYYLEINESNPEENHPTLMAILLEYGEFSSLRKEYLEEYGNRIGEENVFTIIKKYFIQ